MRAKTIMIQGTGSHVGKSVFATALCRLIAQDGYKVAPFKSQNMALNSFVTREGDEMGRSQAVQAEAAGVLPHVDMNPILLKPTSDMGSEVIVRGRSMGVMRWREYSGRKAEYLAEALAAFQRLARDHDVLVIEGAGSPAEVNLREGDIVNMRIAKETKSPVYLVTDIDRGGALAWIVGTMELLQPEERALVKGIVFNKFRGDVDILRPGLTFLEERLGVPVAGVIPYVHDLAIAAEDSVSLEGDPGSGQVVASGERLDVAVVQVPYIANFTDVDALKSSPDVQVRYVRPGQALGSPDLLVLPSSTNLSSVLDQLRVSGMATQIVQYANGGGCVLGVGGGYPILGEQVADSHLPQGAQTAFEGLGLLPVRTVLHPEKGMQQVRGHVVYPEAVAAPVAGYLIRTGRAVLHGGRPWLQIAPREGQSALEDEGCWHSGPESTGLVFGTFVHGILDADEFRRRFLDLLRSRRGWPKWGGTHEESQNPYDVLAATVRANLDVKQLYRVMGL